MAYNQKPKSQQALGRKNKNFLHNGFMQQTKNEFRKFDGRMYSVEDDYPESPLKINLKPTLKNDSTLNTYHSSKADLHNFNPQAPKVKIQVSNRNNLDSPRNNHKIQDFFEHNNPQNTTLKRVDSSHAKEISLQP